MLFSVGIAGTIEARKAHARRLTVKID